MKMRLEEAREVLGLPLKSACTMEELRKAYKKKTLLHHPDKNIGDENATERFQRVGDAYSAVLMSLERNVEQDEEERGSGGRRSDGYAREDDSEDEDDDGFDYENMFQQQTKGFFFHDCSNASLILEFIK